MNFLSVRLRELKPNAFVRLTMDGYTFTLVTLTGRIVTLLGSVRSSRIDPIGGPANGPNMLHVEALNPEKFPEIANTGTLSIEKPLSSFMRDVSMHLLSCMDSYF